MSAPFISPPAGRVAPPQTAAETFAAAVAYHQAGATGEAERHYRDVIALSPDHPDAHSRLGAVLSAQGKFGEAIFHLERALAVKPDIYEAWGNLAQAHLWAGHHERAVKSACRLLELKETDQGKVLFVHCASLAPFTEDDGRCRTMLLRALSESWARPRELGSASISLIKCNNTISAAIARVNAVWPARLSTAELLDSPTMAVAQDELLCRLLENDPVTDIGLERLLTSVRHAMLTSAVHGCEEGLLSFYCAVARQCFINQYVFAVAEGEAAQAEQLRASLEAALAAGEQVPALWPVVVASYFPLYTLAGADRLLDRSWPQAVNALLTQEVKEPAQEREIAATMPVLTGIDDRVSKAVRQQYEENPYPRWVSAGPPGQPAVLLQHQPEQIRDVLIAGCGTGLSTIELARQARQARILAIDLSLASLSYAKRMAQVLGIANLEFAQADILQLGSLGRQFDFIDCSGVLHHLTDPWHGWRILLSLLRPGGSMQVALYSRLARRNVVAARSLIAERGYQPTAEDIRRCRQEIMASSDPLLQSVTQWADFFATNECRDLIFHVQEHQISIPEIKAFLAANDLKFGGFVHPPATLHKFATRFRHHAAFIDLDCWHAFETEAPDTFTAMYVFSVQKPSADDDARPAQP